MGLLIQDCMECKDYCIVLVRARVCTTTGMTFYQNVMQSCAKHGGDVMQQTQPGHWTLDNWTTGHFAWSLECKIRLLTRIGDAGRKPTTPPSLPPSPLNLLPCDANVSGILATPLGMPGKTKSLFTVMRSQNYS